MITAALIKIAASGDLVALKHACLRHKACRGNAHEKQVTERRNRFGSWKIGDDGIAQLLTRGHLGDFVEMFKILDAETEAVFRTARQHGARESQGAYRHDAIRNLFEGRPSGTYGPDASGTTYHPTNTDHTDHTDEEPPAPDVDPAPPVPVPGTGGSPVCGGCGGPVTKSTAPAPPAKAKKRDELSVTIDLGAMRRGYLAGDETCEILGIGVVPDDGPLALWSSNRLCQKHHNQKTRKH